MEEDIDWCSEIDTSEEIEDLDWLTEDIRDESEDWLIPDLPKEDWEIDEFPFESTYDYD